MIHCYKPGERIARCDRYSRPGKFTIPDGDECCCDKCGWTILIHEGMVHTSNRYAGSENWYHSWCHDQGYRCKP